MKLLNQIIKLRIKLRELEASYRVKHNKRKKYYWFDDVLEQDIYEDEIKEMKRFANNTDRKQTIKFLYDIGIINKKGVEKLDI